MPTLRVTPMGLAPAELTLPAAPPELLDALSASTRSLPDQKLFKRKKAAAAQPEEVPGAYCSYTFHMVFEEGDGPGRRSDDLRERVTSYGGQPWHLKLLKNVPPPGKPLRRATADLPRLPGLEDMRSAGWVLVEVLEGGAVTASRKFFR